MNWFHKIEALLRPNPLAAFGPTGNALRRLQSAFPEREQLDERVTAFHQQSLGLELLVADQPFDYNKSRSELLVRHPLSGAPRTFPLPRPLTDDDVQALHARYNVAVASLREDVCGSTGPENDDQAQRLFFALWRLLPQQIRKLESKCDASDIRLGKLWDILPADPRMPATTIWQQSSLASALAGAGEKPALAVVDIAGIQAFLGIARRTQDLWAGSYLASYLIWRAIAETIRQFGPDCFLFPSLQDSPVVDDWLVREAKLIKDTLLSAPEEKDSRLVIGSFPERLTAILPGDRAVEACLAIENTICSTWRSIADQVRKGIETATWTFMRNWSPVTDPDWQGRWRDDIDSVWRDSVTWVVVPWPSDSEVTNLQDECKVLDPAYNSDLDQKVEQAFTAAGGKRTIATTYSIVSRYAGRSLQARKMHRDFAQSTAMHGFHCSLSGTQLAVQPHPNKIKRDLKLASDANAWTVLVKYWRCLSAVTGDGQRIPKMQGRIRPNEQLSCTSLVKRFALQEYFEKHLGLIDRHIFPSTAGVATAHFKAAVLLAYKDGRLREELKNYVDAVRDMLKAEDAFYPANPLPRLLSEVKLCGLENDAVVKAFLEVDGDWLYPGSFESSQLDKEYGRQFEPASVARAVAALNQLLKAAKRFADAEPGRKMVIVSMDGDKLGEWIAGGRAPNFLDAFHPDLIPQLQQHWPSDFDEVKQPLTLARHLAISEMLRVFSQNLVPQIVEKQFYAKIVYCGGDDVLAVVAVEDLLELCEALRRAFVGLDRQISQDQSLEHGYFVDEEAHRMFPLGGIVESAPPQPVFQFSFDDETPNHAMTCSIGAVMIHERSPLSHAIFSCFNEALKHGAKERRGRNAFEFHLQQRSGSVLVCGGRWSLPTEFGQKNGTEREPESTVFLLNQLRCHFQTGKLSPRLVSDMARYANGFSGPANDTDWLQAGKAALKSLIKNHTAEANRAGVYKTLCLLLDLQHAQRAQEADELTARGQRDRIPVDDSWQQVCDLMKAIQSL